MRFLIVAAALAAVVAVPSSAEAQRRDGAGVGTGSGNDGGTVRSHRRGGLSVDIDRDRRDRRNRGDVFFAYRDLQGDTLFRPDGFNDWWHNQPNRAYPAWVGRNQDCQRMWWSGGGWRC